MLLTEITDNSGQACNLISLPSRQAQLQQSNAANKCTFDRSEKLRDFACARGRRNQIAIGQAQGGDNRAIGFGKQIDVDIREHGPSQRLTFARAQQTGMAGDRKHIEADAAMRNGDHAGADVCLNTELFLKLSDQGGFRSFSRLDLATGKFPETRQVLARRTLGEQHATTVIANDSGDDMDTWY